MTVERQVRHRSGSRNALLVILAWPRERYEGMMPGVTKAVIQKRNKQEGIPSRHFIAGPRKTFRKYLAKVLPSEFDMKAGRDDRAI